jgi:putative transcriptional regulator
LDTEISQRGLTYTAVGKATGVSRQMISHIVNCRHNPGWELQQRLVNFFNIPAEELLAVTEENPNSA